MLHTAAAVLEQARQVIRENGRDGMSQALWCDQGGHAFSERDPGRQRVNVNMLDDDGNEVEMAKDLCGECAVAIGITTPRKTRSAPAITATVQDAAAAAEREDDHVMLRQLQRELAELRAQQGVTRDDTAAAGGPIVAAG